MEFGICNLGVIPVRSEPDDRAEMTTQLLFGELVVITDCQKSWRMVRSVDDNYEGWIDEKQYKPLQENEFHNLKRKETAICTDLMQIITEQKTGRLFPVPAGSNFPGLENNSFSFEDEVYQYSGEFHLPRYVVAGDDIMVFALMFLRSPYLWGGKTAMGIDCSGLVQVVYKMAGIQLLRDASQQATQGELISFPGQSQPGDLFFFDNEEGNIIHVGILLEEGKIIHASGSVRIDKIDHQGIYNSELNKYTHKLRVIKRIL